MNKTWPTLYVKTASGSINYWHIRTEEQMVHMRWGQVGTTSPLTDSYEAVGKNAGRANETTPEEQAQKEAQAKFDKQLRLKYVHSPEEAETNINIKPMRAYVLDDKRAAKLEWPVTVQPKFNGVRCLAYNLPDGSVRLMSRGGKDYTLPHIQDELKGLILPGACLDGELYVHKVSLQTQRHYIETPCEETTRVEFVLYDCTSLEGADRAPVPWRVRRTNLKNWFAHNINQLSYTVPAPNFEAHSMEDVDALHTRLVAQGYEGVMVRTVSGSYRMGAKSTQLLKYKKFMDEEFVVVGWGQGKDSVVIYKCAVLHQSEGLFFDVRPMGNAAERAQLLKEADSAIGKKLTVRFQEYSDDGIPIFPVGVAFRPEKDLG